MASAMLAALTAWLLVPAGGTARLRSAGPRRTPAWLAPEPGAPSARVRLLGGACAGVGCWLLSGGGWPATIGSLAASVVAVWGLGRLGGGAAAKRQQQLVLDLPQALDLLVSCLDAGLPLRVAVQAVAAVFEGPLREELVAVGARTAVGAAEASAWRAAGVAGPWGRVARDVARAVDSGTTLSATLRRHAEDARAEREAVVQSKARAVGVRSVLPLMVCFLPAFLLVGVVPVVAGVAMTLW